MSKIKQWYVLALATVAAVLGTGWVLVVGPQRSAVAELRERAVAEQAAGLQTVSQLQVLRAQAAEAPAQQKRLKQFTEGIPATPDLSGLVRSLTDAADETGVKLQSVSPQAPVAAAGYTEIPVSLVVTGNFFTLEQFLGGLADLSRQFVVSDFGVSKAADADDSVLQLSLNGKVFTTAAPPAGSAGAPAPAAPATGPAAEPAPVAIDGTASTS
ncbi:MAG: type 4a pilus biogenesis protein PilO [Actinomycetota bacterium]|nr:type 4a pilus biogenesis protein PilO [Actinomycetota bacterium]